VRDASATRLLTATFSFTLYLSLDQKRRSQSVRDRADGQKLRRTIARCAVRKAMSMGLSRVGLADGAMEGGEPASQFMPPGFDGYDPGLKVPAYDRAGARALLARPGIRRGLG